MPGELPHLVRDADFAVNGKTHATATVALAACVLPFALLDARALVVHVGVLSNLLVGPDLDVDGWGGPPYRLRRLWEPLGWLWRTAWRPYALLMRHRGVSHWPVVGTLTRLAYLSLLLALWAKFGTVPWAGVAWWAAGLALADIVHEAMDLTIRGV